MSIASQVARIKGEKSRLGIKLSEMGLASQTDKLETMVDAVEGIVDNGAVTATVRQGESYTIPPGYHNGGGTVLALDNPEQDASKYLLQTKKTTPTKSQQSVTPDQGYYGLSSVTVERIPDAYQDTSQVTATAKDVLGGKTIVTPDGTLVAGEIPKVGGKTVIPSRSQQVAIEAGKYAEGNINVSAIPDYYVDADGADATPNDVANDKFFVGADRVVKQGALSRYNGRDIFEAINVRESTNEGKINVFAEIYGCIIPEGAYIDIPAEEFGNAAEGEVLEGASFTSISGYRKEGTIKRYSDEKPNAVRERTTDNDTGFGFSVNPGYTDFFVSSDMHFRIPKEDLGTVGAEHVASGYSFTSKDGIKINGSMQNNGVVEENINLMASESVTLGAGYYDGVKIGVTSDLENELASI